MEQNVVLEMRDISKNFTGVRALSHVDFTLRKGEIHALMGENGAGKSTLIKVLTIFKDYEVQKVQGKDPVFDPAKFGIEDTEQIWTARNKK